MGGKIPNVFKFLTFSLKSKLGFTSNLAGSLLRRNQGGKFSRADMVQNIKEKFSSFKRMKTVFAHANFDEFEGGATISCVVFDKTGEVVITGADDL
jgi:superoxide dismutase